LRPGSEDHPGPLLAMLKLPAFHTVSEESGPAVDFVENVGLP